MQRLAHVQTCMAAAMRRSVATSAAQRPLSPHLEIYRYGLSMIASGAFRTAGLVLFGGVAGLSIAYLPSSVKYENVVAKLQQYPLVNALVKFGVAFPVTYHLLGGLRHLAWDNQIGQNMKWNRQTGAAAFAISGLVGLWAMLYQKPAEKKHIH